MIDKTAHPLQEADSVRQNRVSLKRGLIRPARMHIEQSAVADAAIVFNGAATWLGTRWQQHVGERRGEGVLAIRFGVKPGKDEEFHCLTALPRCLTAKFILSDTRHAAQYFTAGEHCHRIWPPRAPVPT
jgi:hypothetical protein